jgi:hypothetical protein
MRKLPLHYLCSLLCAVKRGIVTEGSITLRSRCLDKLELFMHEPILFIDIQAVKVSQETQRTLRPNTFPKIIVHHDPFHTTRRCCARRRRKHSHQP